jgi:hydroxymethylglutaryl-CoA synthase
MTTAAKQTSDIAILSAGAYLPRLRLQRKAIADANGWFNPSLKAQAKGERAMAGWDEDSVTMAVEAARGALAASDRLQLAGVMLASTTHPFADRQNAGLLAAALNLPRSIVSVDLAGSLRCGTSAIIAAADSIRGGRAPLLVAATDHRRTKAASSQEMQYGDGAAALVLGSATSKSLARLVGSVTDTVDFVSQFRAQNQQHDYGWEERWIRDEGYLKLVPAALKRLFDTTGISADRVAHFCMPATLGKVGQAVAKRAGLPESSVRDTLAANCGDTGAAHPLLMLIDALAAAKPGEMIVVVGFGAGCDGLLLEVTNRFDGATGVQASLARRQPESAYQKLLSFNNIVDIERGMRAEVDKGTPLTSLYRNREMLLGLIGGRCRKCFTMQFPSGRYCVNPGCNALDSQDDYPFADEPAAVRSYTADALTYSADPPAYYGLVQFDRGGRMMADFTDIDPQELEVGLPMRMVFRIKDVDTQRGFVRYFWKAAPR